MNLNKFINTLDEKGISLWVDKDKLHYKAPKDTLTDALLEQIKENKSDLIQHLQKPVRENKVPLSFSQRQIWINDQMNPGNPAYNVPFGYRITGLLNYEFLEKSFNKIIERHEVLRTTFTEEDNEPVQIVHHENKIKLELVDISGLTENETEIEVQKLASHEAVKQFDLSKLPLIRLTLFKIAKQKHILIINLHHIISDGWSLVILMNEVSEIYKAFETGEISEVPRLSFQYGDYSIWDNKRWEENNYDEQSSYWKNELNGELPVLDIYPDKSRPGLQTFKGANNFFLIPNEICGELQEIAIRNGSTFFMIVLAAYHLILSLYSNQKKIIIGTPFANRNHPDANDLIGYFVNMTAICLESDGNPDFITFLGEVRNKTLNAFSNQDVPFEKIVESIKFRRDPSRTPLFQATLEVSPRIEVGIGELQIERFRFDTKFSQFDLSLHMIEEEEGYQTRLEYNTDLFNEETIKRLSKNFIALLKSIAENPYKKVNDFNYLDKVEYKLLTEEWNNTDKDFPSGICLHQIFEKQVERTPNKTALIFEGKKFTYQQLNSEANQLAEHFRTLKIKPNDIVGIYLENSIETVISIFAALKSGAGYLPIDPIYPKERINFMIKDSGLKVLITNYAFKKNLESNDLELFIVDEKSEELLKYSKENKTTDLTENNTAYVIYTSGSTGLPKGAIIPHKAICNHMFWIINEFNFKDTDIGFQKTPVSFDASVWEFYAMLFVGGTLILSKSGGYRDAEYLAETIYKHSVTVLQLVPTQLQMLLEIQEFQKCNSLKSVFCGGEELLPQVVNNFYKQLPFAKLCNLYGPSETTIDSTFWRCSKNEQVIPIGKPINNVKAFVLNSEKSIVPVGVPGELCIGGVCVANGYINRPELNKTKFIDDTFSNKSNKLYKTGDRVRYLQNGSLQFLGRIDHQVKLRGFRIELGEIDEKLKDYNGVDETVTILSEDLSNEKKIISYIVCKNKNEIYEQEIKKYLKIHLPNYMIPASIIFLDKLPQTPNGKIDREALPEPDNENFRLQSNLPDVKDELELQLMLIWKKLLRVKQIALDDDFFEMGGHSLLAVKLFKSIESKFNRKLPLSTLFQKPTIREIAEILREGNWKPVWNSLVPINTEGKNPPLFLIHSAGGNVILYRDLAKNLGKDQPVFGLQARGLNGKEKILTSIEEMAEAYVKEIKDAFPDGPYLLGGYCMGGLIALEIAAQLLKSGSSVPLLIFIETYNLEFVKLNPIWGNVIVLLEKLYFHAKNIQMLKNNERMTFFRKKYDKMFAGNDSISVGVKTKIFNNKNNGKYNEIVDIKKMNDTAAVNYKVPAYPGKILNLIPHRDFSCYERTDKNWKSDNINTFKFKTYPSGIIYEPFVKELSERIKKEINTALIA